MPDVVDAATRSRMMAGIKGANTRPEVAIRKALHARGLRYRLHVGGLPGRPDIFFPRHRAAVFVHGCFWHGHDCSLFRMPDTRREFWSAKIERNRERDARSTEALQLARYRVLTIWECAVRGPGKVGIDETADRAAEWVRSGSPTLDLRGN
jgi:DNA mismatch endonuclease, patch repair protein